MILIFVQGEEKRVGIFLSLLQHNCCEVYPSACFDCRLNVNIGRCLKPGGSVQNVPGTSLPAHTHTLKQDSVAHPCLFHDPFQRRVENISLCLRNIIQFSSNSPSPDSALNRTRSSLFACDASCSGGCCYATNPRWVPFTHRTNVRWSLPLRVVDSSPRFGIAFTSVL